MKSALLAKSTLGITEVAVVALSVLLAHAEIEHGIDFRGPLLPLPTVTEEASGG